MRHQKKNNSLSRKAGPRKALIKNLLNSLILYEKIKTTETKAKVIKPKMERMITRSKKDTLSNRRHAYNILPTKNAVKKLYEKLGPKYKEKQGGYTRITKLMPRKGDGAKMAVIELI